MAEYGYVYKTTNLINGRIYIGQKKGTINLSYLGSGKLIEKAILRYGKNNFRLEVLAFATTKPMLDGLEQKYIYEYRQQQFLYHSLMTEVYPRLPGLLFFILLLIRTRLQEEHAYLK